MEYSEENCDGLKSHCRNGKSLESYCARIGVTPKIISQWYQDYPNFKDAVEMSPCLELLFWEEKLIECFESKQVDFLTIIKSRIDNLLKLVTSPIKRETFNDLKEDTSVVKVKQNDDLLKDFNLLQIKGT